MADPIVEYRPRLLAYLLHLVGDPHEAEDLLQELSLVVLQQPAMLARAGDLFASLRGTPRHLAAGRHGARLQANEALRRWTEWAWENDPGDASTEDARRRQIAALRRCREELQDRARELVSLRYDLGLDIREIAGRLGSSLVSVKVTLLRIRRALAQCIQGKLREEAAP